MGDDLIHHTNVDISTVGASATITCCSWLFSSFSFCKRPIDIDDLDYSPAAKEAMFETLADGSMAYIVQPGTRIMLNIEELLEG
eukprot:966627-Ditylum_brightwellii.AAC.1